MISRQTTLRSAKRKQERKKKFIFSSAIFTAVFVVFAVVVSFGLRIERFQIKSVRIEGESVVSPAKITALVESILDAKYLLLFSQRNTFLYPSKTIAAAITQNFERVLSAEPDVTEDNVLVVHVADREPHAIWCGSVKVPGASDCYFIDTEGRIFAAAPYFSGTAFIKYYGVVTGEPIGAYLLPAQNFIDLEAFVFSLRGLSLEPQDVVLGAAADEIYFRGGSKIIFKTHDAYAALFESLKTVLGSIAFKNAASSTKPFEYIDLRFQNRIFYK